MTYLDIFFRICYYREIMPKYIVMSKYDNIDQKTSLVTHLDISMTYFDMFFDMFFDMSKIFFVKKCQKEIV